jgi:protoheme IX farnesyltransferase
MPSGTFGREARKLSVEVVNLEHVMLETDNRQPLPALLATTAVGVYVLVVAGATASIAEAASTCSSWPVCQGPVGLSDPALLVAWGHRVTALVVGLLVLATAAAAVVHRAETRSRVLGALGVAVLAFPVQVALGAVVVTSGAAAVPAGAHLAVGMGIFTALALALAWDLEPDDGTASIGFSLGTPDVEPADLSEADSPTDPGPALSDTPLATRVRATLFAYFRLMKPRLMWLLCLVAAAAMALAPGELTVRTVVLTLSGGVLSIGASGTFNHVLERDRDERMSRTNDRPTVTHQVPVQNAVVFGFALVVAAVVVFAGVNLLTAALGLVAVFFYSVIYTLVLKPNTVQNTVIGGAAGALPALIGSAAVMGRIELSGVVLAAVIFLWTPAHFYNLALAYKEDYARGGFPMMPVVRGEAETRKHILLYLAATLLAAVALAAVTELGWLYAATTSVFGALFLWAVLRLHRERTESAAFRAFHASNAYLGALLIAVVVDALAL